MTSQNCPVGDSTKIWGSMNCNSGCSESLYMLIKNNMSFIRTSVIHSFEEFILFTYAAPVRFTVGIGHVEGFNAALISAHSLTIYIFLLYIFITYIYILCCCYIGI